MAELDEKLQEYIDELERGIPLDSVLKKIPTTNKDLAQLVRLAASVRSMHHPEPAQEHHSYQLEKILRASREIPTRPTWPTRSPGRMRETTRGWRGHWTFYPGITGLAILFLFIAVSFAGAGVWLSGPPSSHYVTIMDVVGDVTLAPNPNSNNWQQIASGEKAYSNQVLRTGENSDATLLYFDGTRMVIGPDSELTLTNIRGGWGNVLRVQLDQKDGFASYNVVPLHGGGSQFIVNTPSGMASVRGTHFSVDVAKNGQARFAVTTGKVLVTNANSQVSLAAGQATASQPGSVPQAAAYQFTVQGPLSIIQDQQWVVSGVIFTVNKGTVIEGTPKIGDDLAVAGRILSNGVWIADSIALSMTPQQVSTFMGTINTMDGSSWVVSGVKVQVNDQTYISEGININDAVQVTFTTQKDGTRLAMRIESLQVSQDPSANPDLIFQPDSLNASGCDSDYRITGSLINKGVTPGDKAANVDLDYVIIQGSEYINQLTVTPSNWDVINAGEQVSYTVHVNLNPDSSPLPEGKVLKVRVFVSQESYQPGKLKSSAVITFASTCQAKTTATTTATATPLPTATLNNSPVPTSTETEIAGPTILPNNPEMNPNASCLERDEQPEALRLAQEFNTSPEDIMGWFCQGYGFGEIEQAYQLGADTQTPVETIFSYRSSGMGWGNIKKLVEDKNKNHPAIKHHVKKPTRH